MEGIINLERIDNVERHEGDPSRDDQFQDIYHLSRSRWIMFYTLDELVYVCSRYNKRSSQQIRAR